MDDVTDTVFRQIINDLSRPDVFYTEFCNVDGIQSPGRDHVIKKLKYSKKELPIVAQIWGRVPANYKKTANELVALGFSGVDINMGCPAKTVTKNGCCSALIDNRELASEIIQATKSGLKGRLPLSVKTRLGKNSIDYSWIEFLLEHDLDLLTIHARTVRDMSKVPARWDAIEKVVQLRDKISPKTKIILNGDITNRDHGNELVEKYNLDGVMIGRAIFQNPFVFSEVKDIWQKYTVKQKIELFKKHIKLYSKTWGDSRQINVLNKFCKVYIEGFDGAKEFRQELMLSSSAKELITKLDKYLIQ